jgi:hypothetical protein
VDKYPTVICGVGHGFTDLNDVADAQVVWRERMYFVVLSCFIELLFLINRRREDGRKLVCRL